MATLAELKAEIRRTQNDLAETQRAMMKEEAMGRGPMSSGPAGPEYERLSKLRNQERKDLRSLQLEKEKLNETEGIYQTGITKQIASMEKWGRGIKNIVAGNKELQYTLAGLALITGKLNGLFSLGAGILKTLYAGLTKTAKFLVSMPIQIGEMAGKMGNDLRKELVEVIGQATENAKEFFDTASNGGTSIKKLGKMMGSREVLAQFQDMNSELVKLFGPGAQGAANAMQQHEQHIQSMGQFAEFFADSARSSVHSVKFLHTMVKGLGMTAEDIKYLSQEAMLNGESYTQTFSRVAESADSVSKEFGVNRKRLSVGFFELRKDITQFGHLSNPALMRVAARATQMGISIKDLSGVMKKFDTFENAAQSAAMLQQTFGMNIDAIDLLKAKDPMEIVEMFRTSFLQTGRNFEQMTRQSKDFIAQQTGLAPEVLKQIFNSRNLGKSYEEIKKQLKDQKPENQQIAAMKKLDSSVSQVQKTIEGKGFFENFKDGLTNTIKYNSELGRTFVDVNKRMEEFYNKGIRFSKAQQTQLDDILKPFTSILKNEILGDDGAFGPKTFDKMKSGVLKNLSEFMNEVFNNPSASVEFLGRRWQKKAKKFFSFESLTTDQSFIGKIFRTSGKIIGYFVRGFVVAAPAIIDTVGTILTEGLSAIEEFLDPSEAGNFSKDLYRWLGFNEKQGEEVFAGLKRAIKEFKRLFVGDGTDGFITKAFNSILSIGTSIGSRIMDGFNNNKKALNEVVDALSFGFYSRFMSFAATSPLFSHMISESSARDSGADMTKGTLKRNSLTEASRNLLGDERIDDASYMDGSDEAENFRAQYQGKAGALLYKLATGELGVDQKFIDSVKDPTKRAALKKAYDKMYAAQVRSRHIGRKDRDMAATPTFLAMTPEERQKNLLAGLTSSTLGSESTAGSGNYLDTLRLANKPSKQGDDFKQLKRMMLHLGLSESEFESFHKAATANDGGRFGLGLVGTSNKFSDEELESKFLNLLKSSAERYLKLRQNLEKEKNAVLMKRSQDNTSLASGVEMMYTQSMSGVSAGYNASGIPFHNPGLDPSEHTQGIPGFSIYNPITNKNEPSHSGEISKDSKAYKIKHKLKKYKGTGAFDTDGATKTIGVDNAMVDKIARLVDDGDNHKYVSANDIYALVYAQGNHIKTLREDFNKSIASDKDKSVNVIVTLEGHEFVSKAIKIANEQLVDPSRSQGTQFTGGSSSSRGR